MANFLTKLFTKKPLPQIKTGEKYVPRDYDEFNLVAYVIPVSVDKGVVRYMKYYWDNSQGKHNKEKCSEEDFNKWFRYLDKRW